MRHIENICAKMSSVDPSTDLTSSNDKQNALDAIPTSSTDANVTYAKTESGNIKKQMQNKTLLVDWCKRWLCMPT